ncbi:hypothetical protein CHS0354_011100 [Potamilus streckersoni]|uniref:C-factor n=1 Tax=Potamilus streckersoni TaxID=2493646 RepID=A0AAE0TCU8_9BIVA|nr:hypothetical protein CHS0354_011100 [Potamilus streckersoni]
MMSHLFKYRKEKESSKTARHRQRLASNYYFIVYDSLKRFFLSFKICISITAALNHLNKSISIHVKEFGILSTVLHPGWVKTDMGGQNAHLGVEESVKGLLDVCLKLDSESTGKFFDFKGKELPW